MRKEIPARQGYDLWAPTYDASPNPVVALDGLILGRIIGDVTGQTVIDAGCGTGRHTLELARQAARVIAVDFSAEMLARLRGKLGAAGMGNVTLIQHDLHQPLPVADGCADTVVCALVGEHLDPLAPALAELARALRPGGRLVLSAYHPFLALSGKQANFFDPATGVEYRLGARKHLVADYANAMIRAGLAIAAVHEHLVDDELAGRLPVLERYRGMLMLVVLEGRRPWER